MGFCRVVDSFTGWRTLNVKLYPRGLFKLVDFIAKQVPRTHPRVFASRVCFATTGSRSIPTEQTAPVVGMPEAMVVFVLFLIS
jgi:hypothetical protein